jgi:hypothetical protein
LTSLWAMPSPAALKCRSCPTPHPPVHMIKLTENREIAPRLGSTSRRTMKRLHETVT